MDDATLIAAMRGDDDAALRELFERHAPWIAARLRRVLPADAVEDVVQETFVRAFTSLHTLNQPAAFRSWVMRIAYNEALRRTLQRKRFAPLESFERDEEQHGGPIIRLAGSAELPPDEEVHRRQMRRLLEEAIDRLPLNFRAVFVLRDVEGLSVEETAAQLELKPETVRTRHHRARLLLRRHIESRLQDGLSDVFAFAGARCARIRAAVMARLTARSG